MKNLRETPYPIREEETVWIPLSDGCRLAAKLWIPEGAETQPVPAIIEYLPYRRGDGTATRDAVNQRYLAGHGYACLRIDIRGSGDSDGFFDDEYSPQEQADCVEAIAWIASQPWCSGSVGMWGISWGGFNALQVAAHRPPALKAIITVCSTDDRYADDTHYMGGCLLLGNLNWGANMFGIASKPPDPTVVGERWRDIWLARLERIPHLVSIWTSHQRRDAYWRQGSVCEDYAAIECAVFAVGGWADSYTNAIPRLLAGLKAPKLGLIGPWGHAYPHEAKPGPAIGFLQESLRWWDHWLKERDTGIMREPVLRAYMQEALPPATYYDEVPGRWIAEEAWPSPRSESRTLYLSAPGLLGDAPAENDVAVTIASPQSVGNGSGAWCPYGMPGDLPTDQNTDDAMSVVFESAPLAERIEILGAPVLSATVSADRPNAFLVARLSLVSPDGAATRISYGVLNLTHRDSHAEPSALAPGKQYPIRLQLNDVGQAVPAGHRLRLALSNAYWPTIWPSPEKTAVTLFTRASRLDLPVRPPRPDDAKLRPFEPAEGSPPLATVVLRPASRERRTETDPAGGVTVVSLKDRGAERIVESGIEIDNEGLETYAIAADDPLSARGVMRWRNRLTRDGWDVRTESTTVQTATERHFLITTTLDAYEDEERLFSRTWTLEIDRDLV